VTDKRTYKILSEEEWNQAARDNRAGITHDHIAKSMGVSVRSVASHLPAAHARIDAIDSAARATAASVSATLPPPAPIPSIPSIADRKEAAVYWRSRSWQDAWTLQNALIDAISADPPDTARLRAIRGAADALKSLNGVHYDTLGLANDEPDVEMPELIIREILPEEVAELRAAQRREDGYLDDDMRAALRALAVEDSGNEEDDDRSIVNED